MRVVHVIDSGGYYGAEVMLVHLCNAQKQLGLNVEVISIGTLGTYEKPLEAKLRENDIPCKTWRMMALPDLRQSLKILAYCRETGTDVIHSHGYKGNILLGMTPKRWRDVPVISTVHGYTQLKGFSKLAVYQWLDRICLKWLDAVVLVSEGMRHQVNEASLRGKLQIIPNGIPEEISETAHEPISYFQDHDFKIAAIGRLSYEKNFQLLINAMPLVLENIPDAKLVIFGEGPDRTLLENLIADLNLADKVFLPGYIDEPSRVYRHADIFVNCSITEGMPISILEAMREGCPMVCTEIPASVSVLKRTEHGYFLSGLNKQSLAKTIVHMHSEITCENLDAASLTESFKRNFTAKLMASRYLNTYQNLSKVNT